MNNRGSKTVEQLADEFIARGFRFDDDFEVAANYSVSVSVGACASCFHSQSHAHP
jgi:hypothetical protein